MEREKLILSQFRDKFYLSVPKEIEIGNYDYSGGYKNIYTKYTKLFSDKMFVVTRDVIVTGKQKVST